MKLDRKVAWGCRTPQPHGQSGTLDFRASFAECGSSPMPLFFTSATNKTLLFIDVASLCLWDPVSLTSSTTILE